MVIVKLVTFWIGEQGLTIFLGIGINHMKSDNINIIHVKALCVLSLELDSKWKWQVKFCVGCAWCISALGSNIGSGSSSGAVGGG